MKRIARFIAIVLLLSTVIACLAVFPTLATDGDTAPTMKTLFSQSGSNISLKEPPAEMTLTEKTADNGVKYQTLSFVDGWSVEKGGYTKQPYLQFAPAKHYLKDGWREGDTAEGKDDTDYLVIDFDFSTDTNAFDQLYIQTLFYYGSPTLQADGSYKGKRTSAQNGHYALFGDSGEDAYFGVSSDDSAIPIDLQGESEWAHITMIVDATADTSRTMYLYYNGRFVDSRVCMKDTAVYLESVRLCLGTSGVAPDLDNESFSLANTTIKSFPKGYSGELAEENGNLGSPLYPLSSFGDLGYCLNNLPECTVAKITHADSSETSVTRISELDGNLKAGDTVTLYRDIPRKIVLPGTRVDDAVIPAVNFVMNGHSIEEPLVLEDYDSLDWIIRDGDGNLYSYTADGSAHPAKGAQVYTDGALTTDTLDQYLTAAFPSAISGGNTLKITFLKDTSVKYAASKKHGDSHVTYDLNGQTLTIAGGKVPFQTNEAKSRIIVRDGKMINNASNPFYVTHAVSYYISNVELVANTSLTDLRSGTLFFINSKITAKNTVAAVKSYGGVRTSAVFDGCEISIEDANPISLGNLSTSSMRRGSMNTFVGIYNTEASGDTYLVSINYFANEWTGASEAALANDNKATVSLQGGAVNIDNAPAILVNVQSLTDYKNSYAFAEGLKGAASIYIDGAVIGADTLLSSNDDAAMSTINKNNVTVGAYTINTALTVKQTDVKCDTYLFSNTVGTSDNNGAISATLQDEVRLTSHTWSADSDSAVNVDFANGVKLAYSYDVEYPFIATKKWTESTLVGERSEVTTVKLSPIFANGMVLQANKEINIYGSCATVGAEIEVTIGENTASTTVGGDGKWRVTLPPMDYANGVTIYVNELGILYPETVIKDVHVGEIWMISGQSNAVYGTYKIEDFAEYQANADNFDNIYAFAVSQGQSLVEKAEATNSGWYKVTSGALTKDDRYSGISGIAYVMATRLATELGADVAVGIIDINFNGSTVEAWMSPENLGKVDPELNEKYSAYRSYFEENGVYPAESDVSQYGKYITSGKLYSQMACSCYNAMIAPIFDGFTIRGAVWYQGEGNAASVTADDEGDYRRHFDGVRSTFREVFANPDLPVFIIQSPPRLNNPFYFKALMYDIAAKDDNTYVVLSLYAGSTYSENELKYTSPAGDSMAHFERKSPVGHALADSILENVYGMGELSAPNILSVTQVGDSIVITFDRELTVDMGNEMLGFEIRAAGGEWVAAKATYADKTVTLTAEGVSAPEEVRYGADKSILVLEDGTEFYHNKADATIVWNEEEGTVTITHNGNVYIIDTSDPAVIGGRMNHNVVATNGTALPVFLITVE